MQEGSSDGDEQIKVLLGIRHILLSGLHVAPWAIGWKLNIQCTVWSSFFVLVINLPVSVNNITKNLISFCLKSFIASLLMKLLGPQRLQRIPTKRFIDGDTKNLPHASDSSYCWQKQPSLSVTTIKHAFNSANINVLNYATVQGPQ